VRRPARSGRRREPRLALRGALAVLVAGLGLWSVISLRVPFLPRGGQVVDVRLPSAANARNGQPVRVKGIDVGRIEKLTAAPGGGVVARLRIDDDTAVHADAEASLRMRTLFGRNMYIDLRPGSRAAPPLRGEIALDATTSQVDFDQLLAPLDERGRTALRALFTEMSGALLTPEPPREALRLLSSTMRNADAGLPALRGTAPGDLPHLVGNAAKVARAVASAEAQLAHLVDDGETTLGVTAARRADLGRVLQLAPGALANSRRTLARLDVTLDHLDPLVDDLRPAAVRVAPAVAAAKPTLTSLQQTLGRLIPAAGSLRDALRELRFAVPTGEAVTRDLRPILRRLDEQLLPGLDTVGDQSGLKLYQALGPFLAAADSSSGEYDDEGHLMRFQANFGESRGGSR